jgi:hypothetical protein
MKLLRVLLNRTVDIPGHGKIQEVRSGMVEGGLRYDARCNSLIFGNTGKGVPWHCVIEHDSIPEDSEFKCHDCGEEFENSQGLGGHRVRKHKVSA